MTQAAQRKRYNQQCTPLRSYKSTVEKQPPRLAPQIINHELKSSSVKTTLSIARSTRRLLILLQTHQQLPKFRLLTPTRTTSRTLPTQIHQLRNALPARSARSRILATLQELLGLAAGRSNALLLLGVVVLVEVVDVLLGGLDGFLFALGGSGLAVLQGEVAAFAPLLDYFGLFFVFGAGGVVGGLLGLEGASVGDAAAWCYALR